MNDRKQMAKHLIENGEDFTARFLANLHDEADKQAAQIAALQTALAEARGIIRRTKDFADYIGRDVPVFVGGEAELSEAARAWLERNK
jgi:hypothetical protein